MDDQQRKIQLKKTFDTVAEGYGTTGMEFFHHAAAHLPRIFQLQGNEHLLDVATGTGIASTAIAPHLPHGKVIGIDLSEGMLAQARARAQLLGISNIETYAMDMQHITFENASFDAANCSFGIFFLPDMQSLLQHITSKVKPGGQVVISSFYQNAFQPNLDLFLTRIQRYNITPPAFGWNSISTEDRLHALYASAGLRDIQIHRFDVGYFLNDPEDWWRIIWYAGFRGLVAQLSATQLTEFKQQHLSEIAALSTEQGIPLNVSVLFASGRAN